MKIEIKNRFTGKIIVEGDYSSLKKACEKNRANLDGANLYGANLYRASLDGASLYGASLYRASLDGANLYGASLDRASLDGANLYGANLYGASLDGASLDGASLDGANLYGASLDGASLDGASLDGVRNYVNSHGIFAEAVRRQKVTLFVQAEWAAIAQITIHRLCWDAIKKRFGKVMPSIFKKLAEVGFTEWLEYWDKSND